MDIKLFLSCVKQKLDYLGDMFPSWVIDPPGPGVYIKFEIHIFAPPPFLNHIFPPKEIYYNGWVRATGENFQAFFLIL